MTEKEIANFAIVFYIGFGGIVFSLALRQYRQKIAQIKLVLERESMRRGGTVHSSWFFYPSLVFAFEGYQVKLVMTMGGKNSPPRTIIRTSLNPSGSRSLLICRESVFSQFGKIFSGQDVKVGNQTFDDAFVVTSTDSAFVFNVLTPSTQQALLQIKDLNPTLQVWNTRFTFTAPKLIEKDEELSAFVDAGLMILKTVSGM